MMQRGRVDLRTPATLLGPRLLVSGLTVKKYPICFAAHRVVDACLDLVAQHDLRPDQVSAIKMTGGRAQANNLCHHRPADSLQVKFNLEFAVTAALLARRVELEQLRAGITDREALFDRLGRLDGLDDIVSLQSKTERRPGP